MNMAMRERMANDRRPCERLRTVRTADGATGGGPDVRL